MYVHVCVWRWGGGMQTKLYCKKVAGEVKSGVKLGYRNCCPEIKEADRAEQELDPAFVCL